VPDDRDKETGAFDNNGRGEEMKCSTIKVKYSMHMMHIDKPENKRK